MLSSKVALIPSATALMATVVVAGFALATAPVLALSCTNTLRSVILPLKFAGVTILKSARLPVDRSTTAYFSLLIVTSFVREIATPDLLKA